MEAPLPLSETYMRIDHLPSQKRMQVLYQYTYLIKYAVVDHPCLGMACVLDAFSDPSKFILHDHNMLVDMEGLNTGIHLSISNTTTNISLDTSRPRRILTDHLGKETKDPYMPAWRVTSAVNIEEPLYCLLTCRTT